MRAWLLAVVFAELRTSARLRDFAFDYVHHGDDWNEGSCSSRTRQSPIDFDELDASPTGEFSYHYALLGSPFDFENTGHALVADFAGLGLGGLTYEDSWFNLFNVNFHAQSEHTVQGAHYPMEVHLVHKKFDSDALIIVALLVNTTQPVPNATRSSNGTLVDPAELGFNPTLQFFTQQSPPVVNAKVSAAASELNVFDLNTLLANGTFFEYVGSLTAPPCAEIVTWLVRREPITMSSLQYAVLDGALNAMTADFGNYRTTMPTNHRNVTVRSGVREAAPPVVAPSIYIGPNPRTDREMRAMDSANDALSVASSATDYVKDLDTRLRSAALAHARALAPDITDLLAPTPPPVVVSAPPRPTPAVDVATTAAQMAKTISDAAEQAIEEAKAEIAREAHSSADRVASEAAQMVADKFPDPAVWLPQPPATAGAAPANLTAGPNVTAGANFTAPAAAGPNSTAAAPLGAFMLRR